MNIDPVAQSGAARQTGSAQAMGKEDFLKLLVIQLSNQDPLDPMDNQAFIAQLAQFSSLEQLIMFNDQMVGLTMTQAGMSSAQMVSFIGKEVEYLGDSIRLEEGGSPELDFVLEEDAEKVTIAIKDEDGKVIRSMELGGMEAGERSVTWDGRDDDGNPMEPGSYSFNVVAEDDSGTRVEVELVSSGVVTGVTYEDGSPALLVGEDKVRLGDIKSVNG